MPETLLTPASPGLRHSVTWEDLHTALDIILAAAANLRHYRDRLTPEDHTAIVRDIEQAVEKIASGLTWEQSPPHGVVTDGKRRTR